VNVGEVGSLQEKIPEKNYMMAHKGRGHGRPRRSEDANM
jgi:hypothetical protein